MVRVAEGHSGALVHRGQQALIDLNRTQGNAHELFDRGYPIDVTVAGEVHDTGSLRAGVKKLDAFKIGFPFQGNVVIHDKGKGTSGKAPCALVRKRDRLQFA